ncbi:hypothetical protein MON38_05650 [Hymenobacter sp. DH14]|uniref:Uncharacterized protein n=1 Tax=Hymenobacter cyanobacteriorum TaxID=2926463 RepID=A0A9X1VIA6_9BACT|nr:hypothetical protein [Hymenobacter cyanobacteriorum]MCI1186896.1 hypothetical protein [Hymenobacter cyanobacteriorum]
MPKILVVAVLLFGSSSAMAQSVARPGSETLRAENRYYTQSILPQMRATRRQLEPYLSAADKQQLTNYWAQMRRIATISRPQYRPLVPTPGSGLIQEREQRLREGALLTKQLEPLLVRYDQPIQQLLRELQPQRRRWEVALRALHQPATQAPTRSPVLNADGTLLLEQLLSPFGLLTLNPDEPASGASGSKHN